MGSSISGLLAITFLNRLTNGPLVNCRLALYKRYVDDCCLLTTDRNEAEKILAIMNAQHDSIHFDLEHPTDQRTLSLLDFSVTVNPEGSVCFNFFQKRAKKPLFVNYASALPTRMKRAIVLNEVSRISARCTSSENRDNNIDRFRAVLRVNDYPASFINRETTFTPSRRPRSPTTYFYLRLPFISDSVNSRIARIFKRNNLRVRLFHRSSHLRSSLKRREVKPCTLSNCQMTSSGLCNATYCVYELQCLKCSALYIGSTIRPLHIRIREHYGTPRSSVFSHKLQCGALFNIRVLAREHDCTSLRIREALLIKRLQPSINSRQEREEFAGLLL